MFLLNRQKRVIKKKKKEEEEAFALLKVLSLKGCSMEAKNKRKTENSILSSPYR